MQFLAIGDVFEARYRVESTLGEGGFATVYRATELANGRSVALKILKLDSAGYDDETRARFNREANILAALRDPHTVRLLQRGESTGGALYMVFEHVPGQDLTGLLSERGRLATDEVTHLLRQLMMSLREAHGKGLLHRDIKPDNLRVFESNGDPLTLKVLDFGIARGTDASHPSITKTGELIGTPRYMSPEQLRDQPLTQTSDIYSAGMVGLQMLCGDDVLAGNRWSDQLDRLMDGHVIDVAGVGPSATPLLSLLQRMTHSLPDRRPPSAAAVLAALDDLDGVRSPRPAQTTAASTSATRDEWPPTTLILGLAGVVVIGAVMLAVFWPEPEAVVVRTPTLRAGAQALLHSPDVGPKPEPEPMPDAGPAATCSVGFTGTGVMREQGGGRERWLTHIPKNFDPERSRSLVVLMHQLGQRPEDFMRISGFDRLADEEHFVVIAPGRDALSPWIETPDNFDRLRTTIASTVEQLCLDPNRVFVVGQGHISLTPSLTCETWVAAVATHAFPHHLDGNVCLKKKPYLLLAPKLSKHEPFEGGRSCAGRTQHSVPDRVKQWRERNGCSKKRRSTFKHEDGECFAYECEVPFESCYIDGGHNWPRTPARGLDVLACDGPTSDFPAAEQAWRFFESVPIEKLEGVPADE